MVRHLVRHPRIVRSAKHFADVFLMYTAECPANMCSVRPSIDRTEDRIFAVSTTVAKTSLFPAQGSIHLFIKYCMHFVTITKTHALQLMYKHAELHGQNTTRKHVRPVTQLQGTASRQIPIWHRKTVPWTGETSSSTWSPCASCMPISTKQLQAARAVPQWSSA